MFRSFDNDSDTNEDLEFHLATNKLSLWKANTVSYHQSANYARNSRQKRRGKLSSSTQQDIPLICCLCKVGLMESKINI